MSSRIKKIKPTNTSYTQIIPPKEAFNKTYKNVFSFTISLSIRWVIINDMQLCARPIKYQSITFFFNSTKQVFIKFRLFITWSRGNDRMKSSYASCIIFSIIVQMVVCSPKILQTRYLLFFRHKMYILVHIKK